MIMREGLKCIHLAADKPTAASCAFISRTRFLTPARTKGDIHMEHTNLDPKLHPLEAAREYKRALNAGVFCGSAARSI